MQDACRYADRPFAFLARYVKVRPIAHAAIVIAVVAAVLVTIGIGIGALALVINGQTGWHFGTSPLAAMTFAGLAIAGDLLAITLPTAAGALWHARHRVLATSAWLVWTAVAALALLTSLGFIEMNVSDTAAGRQFARHIDELLAEKPAPAPAP